MDLRDRMLSNGDLLRASGRVVSVAGEVRFEPSLPRRLVLYEPGDRPAPQFSGLGVPVHGVDVSQLQGRFDKGDAVEGRAQLQGVWNGAALLVTGQAPPQQAEHRGQPWADPPCPTPQGGWPRGSAEENLDLPDELTADPAVVGVLMVRPSLTQVVLAVVTTDPESIHNRWSPLFPGRLCVVASRWTREQVESVREDAQSRMHDWQSYRAGSGFTDDCQPVVTVKVVHVLPALVAWAATVPDDLVEVEPWLAPVPTRGGDPRRENPGHAQS